MDNQLYFYLRILLQIYLIIMIFSLMNTIHFQILSKVEGKPPPILLFLNRLVYFRYSFLAIIKRTSTYDKISKKLYHIFYEILCQNIISKIFQLE